MKRVLLFALFVLLLSVGVFKVAAQESTDAPPVATEEATPAPVETPAPEQPDPIPGTDYSLVQIVIISLAVLLLGVIAIFGAVVIPLVRNAVNTLPPWAVDLLRKNATLLLDQLDIATQIPGTQLDDQARAELRRVINEILAQNAERAQGLPPGRG